MINKEELKQIIYEQTITFLNYIYDQIPQSKTKQLLEQVINDQDTSFIHYIIDKILENPKIESLLNYAVVLNEQYKFDTVDKQIELKKFFITFDLLPVLYEQLQKQLYNTRYIYETEKNINDKLSTGIENIINTIISKNIDNPVEYLKLIEEQILNEDIFLTLAPYLFKGTIIIAILSIVSLIMLIFRIPARLVLSVSSALKKIGEYLKDIQKDNLTITSFFENIPPECLREFTDLWPELNRPTLDPYKFNSEQELQKYKQEILDKLRKKLMRMDVTRGIYNKLQIAKSKGTLCSVRYFISMTGVLLLTYYHCLAKNGNIKLLNELLKIKSDDIVATDSDILDTLAESIPNICLTKYKDFKKMLKFTNELIKTIYKDIDPELYSKLSLELIQTIDKAHKEGQKLIKKTQSDNSNNNKTNNKRDSNNIRKIDKNNTRKNTRNK